MREATALDVRRIFRHQVGHAAALLGDRTTPADVHAARKAIKRSRATLRLLRAGLGDTEFGRANAALRDAARPLGAVRDAQVLLGLLEALQLAPSTRAGSSQVLSIAPECERLRRLTRRGLTAAALARSRDALRAVHARSARWQGRGSGWESIGPGLAGTYRAGRRALASVHSARSDDELHEWRKQVQYLWHELRVLEPLKPGPIGAMADDAHRLSDRLGDDHDLAVLRDRLGAHAAASPDAALRARLIIRIDRRRARLQRDALEIGRALYREKPKALAARFRRYWRGWQEEGRKPRRFTAR